MSETETAPVEAQSPPVETMKVPPPTSLQMLRQRSLLPAKQAGGKTVADFFDHNKNVLKALLPGHMTPERMTRIAMGALRTTPKLQECTVESLFGAVVKCSSMGLEPNTYAQHVFLIPFWNNKRKVMEVQVIPGYKGLVELARRSGMVTSIFTQVRYANDEWSLRYGTDPEIRHVPTDADDRGAIMGFYAAARIKGEEAPAFEYMRLAEIEKIRDASGGYKAAVSYAKQYNRQPDTPWTNNFEMMGRKTPLRRLANFLPQSVELAHAIGLDNAAEKGVGQGLDRIVLDGDWTPDSVEEVVDTQVDPNPQAEPAPAPVEQGSQEA